MGFIKVFLKILGLELLIIFFFTVNGAFVTLTKPSNVFLQYAGLLPLAVGVYIYLIITKKWRVYFRKDRRMSIEKTAILCSPLFVILALVLFGNNGLDLPPIQTLIFVLGTQILIVAFIEEMFFRGFMLDILISKGVKVAVLTSSLLFGFTHSLQLLGGQSIETTILQITYALLIGMVLSLLMVNQQSIVVAILFHGLNNTFVMMGQQHLSSIYNYIIIVLLLVYTVFLWLQAVKLKTNDSYNKTEVTL